MREELGQLAGEGLEPRGIALGLVEQPGDRAHIRVGHGEGLLEGADLVPRDDPVGLGELGRQHDDAGGEGDPPRLERIGEDRARMRRQRRRPLPAVVLPLVVDMARHPAQEGADRTAERQASGRADELAPDGHGRPAEMTGLTLESGLAAVQRAGLDGQSGRAADEIGPEGRAANPRRGPATVGPTVARLPDLDRRGRLRHHRPRACRGTEKDGPNDREAAAARPGRPDVQAGPAGPGRRAGRPPAPGSGRAHASPLDHQGRALGRAHGGPCRAE